MKLSPFLFVTSLFVLASGWLVPKADAEWLPGDRDTMHYPQLPASDGWSVDFWPQAISANPLYLADDWQSADTGPVIGIHWWYSWKSDAVGDIQAVEALIFSDVAERPGSLLWQHEWNKTSGDWSVSEYGLGDRGWYVPSFNQSTRNDHSKIWQTSLLVDSAGAFSQVAGNTYWLLLLVTSDNQDLGWTTSGSPLSGGNSLWWDGHGWRNLTDPVSTESLDLAFVITDAASAVPAPSTLVGLLTLGVIGLLALARPRKFSTWW